MRRAIISEDEGDQLSQGNKRTPRYEEDRGIRPIRRHPWIAYCCANALELFWRQSNHDVRIDLNVSFCVIGLCLASRCVVLDSPKLSAIQCTPCRKACRLVGTHR